MLKIFKKGMPRAVATGIIIGLAILLIGESIIYRDELCKAIKTIPDLIISIQLKLTKNPEKRCKIQKGFWVESKNCCRALQCEFIDCFDETGGMIACPHCRCRE